MSNHQLFSNLSAEAKGGGPTSQLHPQSCQVSTACKWEISPICPSRKREILHCHEQYACSVVAQVLTQDGKRNELALMYRAHVSLLVHM